MNINMNQTLNTNSKKIHKMTAIALATAILCILGPLVIILPISPVPFSLCLFGIYLIAYILGYKYGTLACCLYLLIGLIGLPVFSSFSGGIAKLFGPTGGYLIGYIPLIFVSGLFIDKYPNKISIHIIGMTLGLIICYTLGTCWLSFITGLSLKDALLIGVIPFIFGDVVKITLALILGRSIRKTLRKSFEKSFN